MVAGAQLLAATALVTACAADDPSWTRAEHLVAQMTLECVRHAEAKAFLSFYYKMARLSSCHGCA
jgi:hypothetical protein